MSLKDTVSVETESCSLHTTELAYDICGTLKGHCTEAVFTIFDSLYPPGGAVIWQLYKGPEDRGFTNIKQAHVAWCSKNSHPCSCCM